MNINLNIPTSTTTDLIKFLHKITFFFYRQMNINLKVEIPEREDKAFLTLSSQPSQSILTLRFMVCNCFFLLCLFLIISEMYSNVPDTPIFYNFKLKPLKFYNQI